MELGLIISIIVAGLTAIGVTVQLLDHFQKKKNLQSNSSNTNVDSHPGSSNSLDSKSVEETPDDAAAVDDLDSLSWDLVNDEPTRRKALDRLAGLEPATDGRLHKELRRKLLHVMKDQTQPATRRCEAGNALAFLGDPRFRSDAWFLADEDLLGFVEIPAGSFQMGQDTNTDQTNDSGRCPLHKVNLETFYISRFPVTVMQYRVFLAETHYAQPSGIIPGFDNHPVVSVSWYDAMQYCHWLNKRLYAWMDRPNPISKLFNSTEEGKPWVITLPSEAEWEKSARGMLDARSYPWGPEVDPNKANYRESGVNKTSTVGCFEGGCSPYKIQDLSGNVLEWTRSNWGIDVERLKFKYPYDPHDGREATGAPDTMLRIMRGGAFNSPAEDILCSCRTADLPKTRYDHVGFRLVITQQPL